MPTIYKILGQVNPAVNVYSNLYSVPSSANAVISTINICNQSTSNTTFDIAVRPGIETLTFKHYLAYRTPIPNTDSIALTIGVTLGANDRIDVTSANANVSFVAFGSEIT